MINTGNSHSDVYEGIKQNVFDKSTQVHIMVARSAPDNPAASISLPSSFTELEENFVRMFEEKESQTRVSCLPGGQWPDMESKKPAEQKFDNVQEALEEVQQFLWKENSYWDLHVI